MVAALIGGACIEAKTYMPLPPPDPTIPTVPKLRMPQNGAYEGSVATGKLQPRFVWEPSAVEAGEVRYELQYATDRNFTAGLVEVDTAEVSHRPMAPLAVSTTPPVGRRYFWRVRACAGEKCSEYSRPWWVNLGRSTKDFNGDGYDDVLVGAHAPVPIDGLTGKAFVYYGGPGATFNSVADGVLFSTDPLGWVGYSVSPAGDFNGDGFADVLVGMPKTDNPGVDTGQVAVLYGGAGGMLGSVVDIYLLGSVEAGARFGWSVSSAGDVNGDGYSDVIVGAPGGQLANAYLYLGSANPPLANKILEPSALIKSPRTVGFGVSVSGAGDLNGDGFADLLMSAADYYGEDGSEVCASEIYLGAEVIDVEKDGDIMGAANEKCSLRAIKAGDLNGDGFSDVVARISGRSQGMRIFLGGVELPKTADMTFSASAGNLSTEIAGVGDINGDGADDVASTERVTTTNPQTSKVSVHLGKLGAKSSVLTQTPAAVISNGDVGSSSLFGWSISAAGDVNGDSFDDFVTGQQDVNGTGRALVYLGNGGATLDATPDGTLSSGENFAFFGYSVAMR
jgi:FG-GAP repeat/FG-GAP-like repeat